MDFSRDIVPDDVEAKEVIGFVLSENINTGMTRILEQKSSKFWIVKEYYKPKIIRPTNILFSDIFNSRNFNSNNYSKSVAWNYH